MTTSDEGRAPIADGTDIRVHPDDVDIDSGSADAPPTSVAEEYRDDETLGGTGGLDAGGAG